MKDKILTRAIMQSKIRQARRSNKYMFGYLIPRSYKEALEFDKDNNNTKWADELGMKWMSKSQMGFQPQTNPKCTSPPQKDQGKIDICGQVQWRHKARLVADGSLTPDPVENISSGVVSLRHSRLVIFLGELNNLELWGADIGNANCSS